ncbi:MAG TPA: YkgJ family cysteine cluster protein [Dissulfurispiraceae bacterium]|nr:YkgJ family cysteine cluster protein [Dissulfurispiraceae bacterium]
MTHKKKDARRKFEVLTPQGYEHGDKPMKMKFAKRTSCVRCGTCCRTNPPTLLKPDMATLVAGALKPENLVVIRDGERVPSVSEKELYEAPFEMIMIRGRDGSAVCSFLSGENVCEIYENRPAQCRAYACFGPQATVTGLEAHRLTRRDIFAEVPVILELMERHNEKCSYRALGTALAKVADGDEAALDAVFDMLQYDTEARPFLLDNLGLPEDVLSLVLGKPMNETISLFGYRVDQEGADYIIRPLGTKETR